MILDELVLHNVGSFAGRQRLLLRPPSQEQPIVLIGAKNGSGKTTMLDAIQLALYGKLAQCSTRGSDAYDEFLRKLVHRGTVSPRGSAIELQFTHSSQGVENSYRIHRSWELSSSSTLRERIEVVRNGKQDKALAEQWPEHIESILPARLSQFFLFDGEKIAALADPATAPEVLRTALDALLGLDIVDRLRTDLLVLERRKRTEALSLQGFNSDIATLEAAARAAEHSQQVAAQELAAARNNLHLTARAAETLEQQFVADGGPLADRQKQLESELRKAKDSLASLEERIRVLAAEELPLSLLSAQLSSVVAKASATATAAERQILVLELETRDTWLTTLLPSLGASGALVDRIEALLQDERAGRSGSSTTAPLLLEADGRAIATLLLDHLIPAAQAEARDLVRAHGVCREEIVQKERLIASVPSEDTLAYLRTSLEEGRTAHSAALNAVTAATEAYEQAQQKRATLDQQLSALLIEKGEEIVKGEELDRILAHSARARSSLERFRATAARSHLGRLEDLIGQAFRTLHRKQDYVTSLRIDPASMTISLFGSNEEPIDADRLSAGERQLLATAILWALAKASGRTLPVIIDTPLGRLDSDHRERLVSQYFPHASHQVILLSTDEEIDRAHVRSLRDFIGRSYLFSYEDSAKSTRILPGYFWQELAT